MSHIRHRSALMTMALLGLATRAAPAQSAADLAAWDGLMLSPFGALPPIASDAHDMRKTLAIRYGRWRFDGDDAPHNNVGATFGLPLPVARAELTATGAYLSFTCAGCSSWAMGGVGGTSTLWHGALPGTRTVNGTIRVQSNVGWARSLGGERSTAYSMSFAAPVSVGAVYGRSYVVGTVVPGLGFGHITSAEEDRGGMRPTLGGALAWTFPSGFGINAGVQRVVIRGGPAQIGVGLLWRL